MKAMVATKTHAVDVICSGRWQVIMEYTPQTFHSDTFLSLIGSASLFTLVSYSNLQKENVFLITDFDNGAYDSVCFLFCPICRNIFLNFILTLTILYTMHEPAFKSSEPKNNSTNLLFFIRWKGGNSIS